MASVSTEINNHIIILYVESVALVFSLHKNSLADDSVPYLIEIIEMALKLEVFG